MDELEELDRIYENTNTEDTYHTDQTNQNDIHLESPSRLSTETSLVDDHRECALSVKAHAPIDDIIPDVGHKLSDEEQTE